MGMQGVLLHYNFETHQGLIRAHDGGRYAFYGEEWRSNSSPTIGDELDFEAEGTGAYDIYVVRPAGRRPELARARGPVPQGNDLAVLSNDFTSSGAGQRLLADWTIIIALVTLLGCLLPYISFGAGSQSLLGIGFGIGRSVDGIQQMETLGRAFSLPTRGQTAQQPRRQIDMLGVRWSLRLGYLLYLIPILSVAVIALGFLQKPVRAVALAQGASCIVLPVVVPILLSFAIYSQLPADLRQIMDRTGVRIDISFLGFGFWVIVLSGMAQLLNSFGYIRKRPIDFMGSR
jgi:hypothetical protein